MQVVRGGSWNNHRDHARVAYRNDYHRDNRNNNLGFRVVLRSPTFFATFFWSRPLARRRECIPMRLAFR